jgi:hypothetical protein
MDVPSDHTLRSLCTSLDVWDSSLLALLHTAFHLHAAFPLAFSTSTLTHKYNFTTSWLSDVAIEIGKNSVFFSLYVLLYKKGKCTKKGANVHYADKSDQRFLLVLLITVYSFL